MSTADLVNVFDSRGEAYHRAFQVFLDHTDQKARAQAWLDRVVQDLPQRRSFIDAGAGDGAVTAWFVDSFERTIAIEPNPSLREKLTEVRGPVTVLADDILTAELGSRGDLVLCSHVFYYIDAGKWVDHVRRLASWLSDTGVLIVVLQNPQTDCMKLLHHFHRRRFDLSKLAGTIRETEGERYQIDLATDPALIATQDFGVAYTVAESMLNLLPIREPIWKVDLEAYVREHFRDPAGGYAFSCDQDFLSLRRKAVDRDRGEPCGSAPPTPPGIRVRTAAVRSD